MHCPGTNSLLLSNIYSLFSYEPMHTACICRAVPLYIVKCTYVQLYILRIVHKNTIHCYLFITILFHNPIQKQDFFPILAHLIFKI